VSTNNNRPDKQDDNRIAISVSVNIHVKRIVVGFSKPVGSIEFTLEQATKHIQALQTGLKALEAIANESNA